MNEWYDIPSEEMTLEQARSAVRELRKKVVEQFANMQNEWISVKDRLPETSMKNILFVIYTPAWHDLTDDFPEDERDFPEEIETVSGWFEVFDNGKKRYWSWFVNGDYQATISNEYSEEMTGCITYITHWMPLPTPPEPENEE